MTTTAMAPTDGPTRSPGRPVAVTGMGATTPLGGDVTTTWEAALAGRPGAPGPPPEGRGPAPPAGPVRAPGGGAGGGAPPPPRGEEARPQRAVRDDRGPGGLGRRRHAGRRPG